MNTQDPVCLCDLLLASQSRSDIIYRAHSMQPMCNPIWLPCGLHQSHREDLAQIMKLFFFFFFFSLTVSLHVCLYIFPDRSAPRGLPRKMRHQIQAVQQMTRPTASTARSATFLLSQRTKKKPRMTSTPHRLYIKLLASSPKLKKRCVRGVTMV